MAELSDTLQGYVKQLVEKQRTGQFEELMGYSPHLGMYVILKSKVDGQETTAAEGITRQDLRKIGAAGWISVNTPRSTWAIKLRPAAFEKFG